MKSDINENMAIAEVAIASFNEPAVLPAAFLNPFQIPLISQFVPAETGMQYSDESLVSLARSLLEVGVIDPSDVSSGAKTTQEIVQQGVAGWINKRVPRLSHMLVSVELVRPTTATKIYAQCEDPDGCDMGDMYKSNGNYALAVMGSHEYLIRTMRPRAEALESMCPGLFHTALSVVCQAAEITVNIHTPSHFLQSYDHIWEFWDERKIPDDDDVRESIECYIGSEDEDDIKALLPSTIVPMLGGSLCLPIMGKAKAFTRRKLKQLGKSGISPEAALVIGLTVDLIDAIDAARVEHARFPEMEIYHSRHYEKGCTLVYEYNHHIHGLIDDNYRNTMELGNGTEYLGVQDLPSSTPDLKQFFHRFGLALHVLACMDNLIGQISDIADSLDDI